LNVATSASMVARSLTVRRSEGGPIESLDRFAEQVIPKVKDQPPAW
jgi:hypothetical protein